MNTCAPHGMHLGSRHGRVRVCTRTACAAISLLRAWSQVKAMKHQMERELENHKEEFSKQTLGVLEYNADAS